MFGLLKRKKEVEIQEHIAAYESMEDVSDVYHGYRYWQQILRCKLSRLFAWEGLPKEIPAAELEHILLRDGIAGIVKTDIYGFVAVPVTLNGVGLYAFYPPYAVWCTPLVEGSGVVNKDIVIIRNDSFNMGVNATINRYARMLADAESTLINTLSNVRRPTMPTAPDETTARSYQAADLANRLGFTSVVLDNNIIGDVKTLPAINSIPTDLLMSGVDIRAELIRQFFGEFGVGGAPSKRAPMTQSEIAADNQICVVSVEDMIESRKESAEFVEVVYGLKLTPSINDAFKPITDPRPADFAEGSTNYTVNKEVSGI